MPDDPGILYLYSQILIQNCRRCGAEWIYTHVCPKTFKPKGDR